MTVTVNFCWYATLTPGFNMNISDKVHEYKQHPLVFLDDLSKCTNVIVQVTGGEAFHLHNLVALNSIGAFPERDFIADEILEAVANWRLKNGQVN